jgi:hypothetical protein
MSSASATNVEGFAIGFAFWVNALVQFRALRTLKRPDTLLGFLPLSDRTQYPRRIRQAS